MKPEIKVQYSLMEKAISILREIEINEAMFINIDNEYLKQENQKLQKQYAETMAELAGELASIGKVTIHEEIKY